MWNLRSGSSCWQPLRSVSRAGYVGAGSGQASTADLITTATRSAAALLLLFIVVMVGTWGALSLLSTPAPIDARVVCVNHQLAPEDLDRPGRGQVCDGDQ
jgi:hypothetical protein